MPTIQIRTSGHMNNLPLLFLKKSNVLIIANTLFFGNRKK